jgi:hypothetical protein
MISLTSTLDSITLVTSAAISTDWVVTYGDETSSGFIPGSNQGNIASTTTTTIVAAPVASTQRNIKSIIITNRHASTTQTVQLFKVYNGTSYAISEVITLTAGQNLRINQDGKFSVDLATSGITVSTFYLGTTAITTNQATGTISSLAGVNIDGSAGSLKSPSTSGVAQLTGMTTGTTRVKTVRDANDTVLELGGSYTPTATWDWTSASVTWPTFNQSTTGSAGSVKSPSTTGIVQFTGMLLGTTRVKTVTDANDTILELGGSYTPTGTWNWGTATVTWPTFNQSTSGSAGALKSPSTTGLAQLTGMGAATTRVKTVRDANDTILELGGGPYTPLGSWNWASATVTWPTPGGDLGGTYPSPTVGGIQGHAIAAPTSAANLRWDGANWTYDTTVYVTGPASATDGNLAVFNGTSGKILKDGGAPPTSSVNLVKKTADESKTSNTTLANDSALTLALSASTSYRFKIKLFYYSASATPNIKIAMAYSGTIAAIDWTLVGSPMGNVSYQYLTVTSGHGSLMGSTAISINASGEGWADIDIAISTTNAGTFAIQWAQNASSVTATTVTRGSSMKWWTS